MQGTTAQVVERRRAGTVDAPGLFAHGDDAIASVRGGSEVDVRHHGERIADGVVDSAFADFAAFDVGDGNAKSESDGSRREHFVTIGDEKKDVRAQLAESVGEAEGGDADGLGHADVSIGAEQALDAGGNREAVGFDDLDGAAEFRREMGANNDEVEIDTGMGR